MGSNAHAAHGDKRTEVRRERYNDLANKNVDELQQMARERGVTNASELKKDDLLDILTKQ